MNHELETLCDNTRRYTLCQYDVFEVNISKGVHNYLVVVWIILCDPLYIY